MVYHYEVSKGAGKVSHLDIILRGFTPYGDCYAISPNPQSPQTAGLLAVVRDGHP